MTRTYPYIAVATLGIAMTVSNPAAAQMFGGFGIDVGTPYPSYYSRAYGYPYNYASYYRAYGYPYRYNAYPYYYGAYPYSVRNSGWAGFLGGLGTVAAAPVELAGTAVAAPFAVAANTQAPVMTGRSVATAQPYYGTRPRHAYGVRSAPYSRGAEYTYPKHHGRSAVSGYPAHHGRSAVSGYPAHHGRSAVSGYPAHHGRSAYKGHSTYKPGMR